MCRIPLRTFFWICVLTCFCLSAPGAETGKTLWSVSTFGESDYFVRPSDLEIDRGQSRIYVADADGNRVLVFDFQGTYVRSIGKKGQGPGEFSRPTGLAMMKDSGLAVADFGNNRIQIFDKNGTHIRTISPKSARVAALVLADDKFYTVPSFGVSGYSVTLGTEEKTQPLVSVLDDKGENVGEISVSAYPESQPFIRAIKHRVCPALSPKGLLFLPHLALNVIHVFELAGKKVGEFTRPLPYKPVVPHLDAIRDTGEGVVQMRSNHDIITVAARFGPDGNLYLLTRTESLAEHLKGNKDARQLPPEPNRLDVIDPQTYRVVRTIPCDAGIAAFGFLDKARLVYIYEDSEGELTLKCVSY